MENLRGGGIADGIITAANAWHSHFMRQAHLALQHTFITMQSPPNPTPPTSRAAYYRGAQGIILVYDVSQRETFDSLDEIWLREVEMYATVPDAIKMVVANKTDLVRGVPGQGSQILSNPNLVANLRSSLG